MRALYGHKAGRTCVSVLDRCRYRAGRTELAAIHARRRSDAARGGGAGWRSRRRARLTEARCQDRAAWRAERATVAGGRTRAVVPSGTDGVGPTTNARPAQWSL